MSTTTTAVLKGDSLRKAAAKRSGLDEKTAT